MPVSNVVSSQSDLDENTDDESDVSDPGYESYDEQEYEENVLMLEKFIKEYE